LLERFYETMFNDLVVQYHEGGIGWSFVGTWLFYFCINRGIFLIVVFLGREAGYGGLLMLIAKSDTHEIAEFHPVSVITFLSPILRGLRGGQ
jgi:hypothetical protein